MEDHATTANHFQSQSKKCYFKMSKDSTVQYAAQEDVSIEFQTDSTRVVPMLCEKRRFPVYQNSLYDYFVLVLLTLLRSMIQWQ